MSRSHFSQNRKVSSSAPPVFTGEFTSSEQTITSAGALTLAHGLSAIPRLVTAELVCQTAEQNFSVGDVLITTPQIQVGTDKGLTIVPDATNLNVRFGAGVTVFGALNKTTGVGGSLTNANWTLVLRAFV